jgi:trimeric autotransporter adhesin
MAVNNLNTGVGIQPTIVDAKGDLIAATANDAVNRLAVGTNGQVLVADSGETTGLKWNNPGTVGGLVHIKTESFSAVSGVPIDNIFSASYTNYLINFQATFTATATLTFRYRNTTPADISSAYFTQTLQSANTTVSSSLVDSNGSSATLQAVVNGSKVPITMTVFTPFQSETTNAYGELLQGGAPLNKTFANLQNSSTSIQGISFLVSAGTMTGYAKIYGFKE